MAERTLAMIKPDAHAETEEIIRIVQEAGFVIIREKVMALVRDQVMIFYQEHQERPFFNDLGVHMVSGPVTVLVLERENAVQEWRDLMGATNPANAKAGTIRARFAKPGDPIFKNVVHGSDSPEAARREIAMFFPGSGLA